MNITPHVVRKYLRYVRRRFLRLFALLCGLLVLFAVLGYLYFLNEQQHMRKDIIANLTAVTDLKVAQLANWMGERKGDIGTIAQNPIMLGYLSRFQNDPADLEARSNILSWMQVMQQRLGYRNIIYIDTGGKTVLALGKTDPSLELYLRTLAQQSMATRPGEEQGDLRLNAKNKRIFLSVYSSLYPAASAEGGRNFGTMVFIIDPYRFLYPLIQSWPTPSRTAEIMLVRREGNEVVYLNELRHRQNTALRLHVSVSREELQSVQTAKGRQGFIEGKDYRGVPVLAMIRAVPGTPWQLVAKVDRSEVYTPIRNRAWTVTLIVLLLMFLSAVTVYLLGYRQQAEMRRKRYEAILGMKRAEAEAAYNSFHDAVTGLYNRVYFEEELRRLDTERTLPISVIMADVNNLKLTNDVFGLREGDLLLRHLADIMRDSCRDEDLLARWGGDEYIILLPRTGSEEAEGIMMRIKGACERMEALPMRCSISLGTACKTWREQDMALVIKLAEERMNKNKVVENAKNRERVIALLLRKAGTADHETREHIERMQTMALQVGRVIGLKEKQLQDLGMFALLHDIGKAGIGMEILSKPSRLTPDEWREMRKHPEIGYRIAAAFPEFTNIAEAILLHHERWDGRGYPRGLKEDQIPLLVRILSIIDSYDVMVHARAYKVPLSVDAAVEELRKGAGRQFDPQLVEVFIDQVGKKGMVQV
jgi:diguanylate cyclase (GGDEF)-like protein